MTEKNKDFQTRFGEGLISGISVGVFFILLGAIFATTPNLFDKIIEFFKDFDIKPVPNIEFVYLPVPKSPWLHSAVYSALGQFSIIWGTFQIVILALRFVAGSSLSKKAETVSDIVFWFGVYYLVTICLNTSTTLTIWFVFWALVIMLIGLSLIVRAVILAIRI
ncbi:MAG: hypothetical protein QXX08_06085 [Candidatus Bathyarchaeia archaeon]